ncbi:hypothetical protein ACFYXQ_12915 [Nocardia jiangxiensis]|uniref:Maleate cis-trans isomerase n=1 Tax=Nocardia jiangxiensis TaxID=282685 RepID=A0ABW6RYV2_9NOCA
MGRKPVVGLLYPTPGAGEDDFADLAARLDPVLRLEIVYIPWPHDVDDLATLDVQQVIAALRRLGSAAHLERVLPGALHGRTLDAVAFAVTSSSFLDGAGAVDQQIRTIERIARCPATSTTAAYQRAIRRLSLDTVALASVYHAELSGHFIERVQEAGAQVVRRVDASARSDRDLATWSPEQSTDLVTRAADPRAQAILLPETALHAQRLTADLERTAGCPVLTATHVTLWAAAQLLDLRPVAPDAGPLFSRAAPTVDRG